MQTKLLCCSDKSSLIVPVIFLARKGNGTFSLLVEIQSAISNPIYCNKFCSKLVSHQGIVFRFSFLFALATLLYSNKC